MPWRHIPSGVSDAIDDYLIPLNKALRDVAANIKYQPIGVYQVVDYPNFEKHALYFLARRLGGAPDRIIRMSLHLALMCALRNAKSFFGGERIVAERIVEKLEADYSAYFKAMSGYSQVRNDIVLPRMTTRDAAQVVMRRVSARHWHSLTFRDPDDFSAFCFAEIFAKRQRGDTSEALRLAYALSLMLDSYPGDFHPAEEKQLAYRALVAFMGGWSAYHAGNGIMERFFVYELRRIHSQLPDIRIRNRIRSHLTYHNPRYGGCYVILESEQAGTHSVMDGLYKAKGGGSAFHNAAKHSLEAGAQLNSCIAELGGRSPKAALELAAELDLASGDAEGAVISKVTLAGWLDLAGLEGDFDRRLQEGQQLLADNPNCVVAKARLLNCEATHHVRRFTVSRRPADYSAAQVMLEKAAKAYEACRDVKRASELRATLAPI